MSRVHVLVEGQTEEVFVRDILAPYLLNYNIHCIPIIISTKRVKSGGKFRGGVISYEQVKKEIKLLLADTSASLVTTMIDYYGFNRMAPFKELIVGNCPVTRVSSLEQLIRIDIGNSRFLPYLQLHEFEALMFASPQQIACTLIEERKESDLISIRNSYSTPEEINDNFPPSKRLLQLFQSYRKPFHGLLIAKRIGLSEMRNECPHFNMWVGKLELSAQT
jgi:hypothetical protein